MSLAKTKECHFHQAFYEFINNQVLPLTDLEPNKFWGDVERLVKELMPRNQALLAKRHDLQTRIDQFHRDNRSFSQTQYQNFLHDIGYLEEEGEDFQIETYHVDDEIAKIAGPQLVVPIRNARFALNAANARWGSLYDALYGTDVISQQAAGMHVGKKYNHARGKKVIAYAKDFLDEVFPLNEGSHHDVESYTVYFKNLLAFFPDGTQAGLKTPGQFVAANDLEGEPTSIILKNNGLHIEIMIDSHGPIGSQDLASIDDIQIESAMSTIMDFEDSVAAVDGDDKVEAYTNWLGLITGSLQAEFTKKGKVQKRKLNDDKVFTGKNGDDYTLHGRSLLMIRNVGHLMGIDLMTDEQGNEVPEGVMDAIVTSLIGSIAIKNSDACRVSNSRKDSIYIVKPKMHGSEEVAFSCELFSRVESILGLAPNTIKIGIMDEERRTSLNLKECIRQAKTRVVFINTGFLDRTGDEIHTSMQAGPFLPKNQIKQQPWIEAYEKNNVAVGLACGFSGKAQIGKGMWAMPDEMAEMMKQKVSHPLSGATTAWVPSPTAATLHALHYHRVDVFECQKLQNINVDSLRDNMLKIALMPQETDLTPEDIEQELENNIQGILGYVVRWVEMGVGCSKVPDINNIALMEDRATLRISSQHIANWLAHKVCRKDQVEGVLSRMAKIVDEQNQGEKGYIPMSPDIESSTAYQAARALIFKGMAQPSGYTEPLLHEYRKRAKYA